MVAKIVEDFYIRKKTKFVRSFNERLTVTISGWRIKGDPATKSRKDAGQPR